MLQLKQGLVWVAGLLVLSQITRADLANRQSNRMLRSAINFPVPRGSSNTTTSSTSASHHPHPTGIPSGPDPGEDCYRPSPLEQNPDLDRLCQCSYYDPEMADVGGVQCWVTCNAYKPEQTKIVPQNDKFTSCINACAGSFEKAKRAVDAGIDLSKRQDDEYWFCHGINFIEGELCEFFGDIGGETYTPYGASCWLYPGIGTG
ncbi:hypothetical protein F5Y19DRAFT_419248 [Xylariaceae sp. FL1651]|nr:hypothetical protein F5Y19DRAFT_419248 [Xylariaceae sp. FL1651]